jgi:glycosyltransferase involved in cell wall biosynthesis
LGHEVIISGYYGLMEGGHLRWRGIPVWPADKDYGIRKTKEYYNRFKCDAVISLQDIWTFPSGYGSDFAWYPYFPIDHDPIPPVVLERLQFARKPIVYSKFALEQLKKLGIDYFYVPHGVDTKVFKPDKSNKIQFRNHDDFVIGCVAVNRGLRKNLDGLLTSFSLFNKRHPESILYLHTNPEGYNLGDLNLKLLAAELGITDSIYFADIDDYEGGNFPDTWMARMYNSLDVFLLPSRGEGFGVPIIEAQACGIPVIVTGATSMPELVGSGWILKNLKAEWTYQHSWQYIPDNDEIVDSLENAYLLKKEGHLSQMGDEARKKALEYDWDRVIKQWDIVLGNIDKHRKMPLSREGIQRPRLLLIPKECEPKTVLDIGCGKTQPYKPYLEGLGAYTGIDIKGGNGVIQADACALPFNDKEFGFVWMSEVLEHIPDYKKAIAEAKRVGVHGAITFPTPLNHNFVADPEHIEVKIKCPIDAYGNGVIIW